VALTNSTTSSGAGISTDLAAALADAMALPTTSFSSHTGTIDWSFALDDSLVQYLAKDETVTATYTITLTDDSGDAATNSTTQQVTVTITGTNDGPVAHADSNAGDAVVESGVNPNNTAFLGNASAT